MSTEVDAYFAEPRRWHAEAARLREILADCDVEEAVRWRKPCYRHGGKNVAIIQEFKDFVALMFFKGALLEDPKNLLERQGENSHAARRLAFKSVSEVDARRADIRRFVKQAVETEKAGESVPKGTVKLELVEELRARLDGDPALEAAFEALTPGRQREYNLHFSGAKKSETRASRVAKCVPKIRAGKGFRER